MNLENLPDFITVKQVADLLGLHTNTVYLKVTSGELPSFKSGNTRRIRKDAFLDWVKKLEQTGRHHSDRA